MNKITNHTLYILLWLLTILFFSCVLLIWKSDDITYNDLELAANVNIQDDINISSNEDECSIVVKQSLPVIKWVSFMKRSESHIQCPNNIQCYLDLTTMTADAYIFRLNFITLKNFLPKRCPEKAIWGLFQDNSAKEAMMNDNDQLSFFNYSSTFSRHSDIPFPLQHMGSLNDVTSQKFFVKTASKNLILNEIAPIMYLQSECNTATERDNYVKKLMEFVKVDSYGACLKNNQLPRKFRYEHRNASKKNAFLRFIARYKFVIAIESEVCDDYITEIFWRPINVGVVPIYFGSPTIRDWLPNEKSAILLLDYPTPKILSEHITKLLQDDNLYEEYLEHKTKGIITNKRLSDEIKDRPYQTNILGVLNTFECFICKKLHDMKSEAEVNRIVDKSHYNCSKPISALTLKVRLDDIWQ